jgi:serine/threonine protein kinase/DNA-binding beta-propeller fold protein YncE
VSEQTPGEFGGSAEFSVGSLIAGYRLEERIGRGGMAVVFRAYDPRLDRQVALKILAPALSEDAAFRQRFIRESRAAAAVDDPHITPVFEAGEANGVLFIAMRYVRGGDVRSLIDRLGALPPDQVAEIVSQVASALDAAHARGLVHRDVKPANMLLDASSVPDRPDHVYLSDFGLSKTSLAVSGLTATGQFLGTLDYIAPEQIEGRPLDGRTDLYALACSAFEMLTGELPFQRDQGMSVMFAHLSEPPPRPGQRRADLAPDIDKVITTGMAKAPANRQPTCREFAAALRRAVASGTGASRRDVPPASHLATQIAGPLFPPDPPDRADPPRTVVSDLSAGRAGAAGWDAAGAVVSSHAGPTTEWPRPEGRSERRQRLPLLIAAACAVALLIGGGAYALSGRGHPTRSTAGTSDTTSVTSLPLPTCTTATAKADTMSRVPTAVAAIGGGPFGIAVPPGGQYSFVADGNAIDMLHNGPSLAPALIRSISASGAGRGAELTGDGKYFVAATGSGAVVVNVAEAEQGDPYPVVGTLTSPTGSGAVQVLISADSQFVFVTLQNSAELAVFNLGQALRQGFSSSDFIGYVPLGNTPVGMTTDGTWLYVVNLAAGDLSVLSLSRAETDPAHAVVATAPAGCQPARALMSPDHQVVWVTARGSDALLGFSATRLRTDPRHALIAKVMVGEGPLGEAFVDHGARIVVVDSNLAGVAGVPSNVAVVSTADALSGKQALLGYIPTGAVPREVAVVPDGATLLVTVQGAHDVEAINTGDLP